MLTMNYLIVAENVKKEIRLLSDFLINQYLVPWDAQLSSLAKELTRVFYLENDYLLITRTDHGVLEDSKYSQRIIQKTLETLLRRLEEISPDLEKFLAFNNRQLRIIDEKLKKLANLLEELRVTKKELHVHEDFFNAIHEYYLFVKNIVEELQYDSTTKTTIYNELSGEILRSNKQKGLELIRFYMICLQNSSLLMDIKQISNILSFSTTLVSANLENISQDDPTLHSQILTKIYESG
jgi:glycerol-3-phosphate responsive antiterminator